MKLFQLRSLFNKQKYFVDQFRLLPLIANKNRLLGIPSRQFVNIPDPDELKRILNMTDEQRRIENIKFQAQQSIAKEDEEEFSDIGKDEQTKLKEYLEKQSRKIMGINDGIEDGVGQLGDRLDEASEEEQIDSDVEFMSVVEVEKIFREFKENTFEEQELHEKIVTMFEKIANLVFLFEFNSEEVTFVFNSIVSKELQYFSSMETVAMITRHANTVSLPYPSYWLSLSNLVLMKYHEMEFNHIIQILYYLMHAGYTDLTLDKNYLNKEQLDRLQKINKYAQFQLMIEYLKDQVENVIDVEIALHEDYLNLQMLYTLCKHNLKDLIPEEKLNQKIREFNNHLAGTSQGLNYIFQEYNLAQVLELFNLVPDELITKDYFEYLVAILSEQLKKSKFTRCRQPTYTDVSVFMRKLGNLKSQNQELEAECLKRYNQVIRVLLQKAISSKGDSQIDNLEQAALRKQLQSQNSPSQIQLINDKKIKDDLEFLQLLKQQNESQIFDADTCKLIVFELSQQILKPAPFEDQVEAQIRLALMLYSLRNYKADQIKEKSTKYMQTFLEQLSKQVFENKEFDKHLDHQEYAVLREISVELERILGISAESQQLIQNLERRVYNYAKLHTF
ncbi:UNKNOWN [Stylonychia lemnae]|uniref:Uncharacterized protein n=1 Tax=Stylonychia lemnae TaxID=5949 RepID=A0A078BA22_STYLE|nr:UNKNOWN [Stylonychia lemnae]|eukprot:CDW91269.1 UNKNOWN [Stylonychia lemnae]